MGDQKRFSQRFHGWDRGLAGVRAGNEEGRARVLDHEAPAREGESLGRDRESPGTDRGAHQGRASPQRLRSRHRTMTPPAMDQPAAAVRATCGQWSPIPLSGRNVSRVDVEPPSACVVVLPPPSPMTT